MAMTAAERMARWRKRHPRTKLTRPALLNVSFGLTVEQVDAIHEKAHAEYTTFSAALRSVIDRGLA